MEKKTLWQRFMGLWAAPPEVVNEPAVFNPLGINVERLHSMEIDTMLLRGVTFIVNNVREYKLSYRDKEFVFSDYYLRPTFGRSMEEKPLKLRVYSHDAPGRKLQTLVLTQHDELDYDKDFKALLDDPQFNIMSDDGKVVEASFWRIDDVKTPYQTKTRETNSPHKGEVWYWDYWREFLVGPIAGDARKEFLFVDWDKGDTGRFTLWRGEEIPQSCVSV